MVFIDQCVWHCVERCESILSFPFLIPYFTSKTFPESMGFLDTHVVRGLEFLPAGLAVEKNDSHTVLSEAQKLCPKWHPIPDMVHYI